MSSDDELLIVAKPTCSAEEIINNERVPVNSYIVFAAIKAADAEVMKQKKYYIKRTE